MKPITIDSVNSPVAYLTDREYRDEIYVDFVARGRYLREG